MLINQKRLGVAFLISCDAGEPVGHPQPAGHMYGRALHVLSGCSMWTAAATECGGSGLLRLIRGSDFDQTTQ